MADELDTSTEETELPLAEEPSSETPTPAGQTPGELAELRATVESLRSDLAAATAAVAEARQVGAAAWERANRTDNAPRSESQEKPARPQPPRLSEAERESFVDADVAERAMHNIGNYWASEAYNRVTEQVAPMLERLAVAAQSWEAMRGGVAQTAEAAAISQARDVAANIGLSQSDFDALVPNVRELLWNAAERNQAKFYNLTTNPQTLLAAAALAKANSPAPVTPTKPAPTIGAPQGAPPGGRPSVPSLAVRDKEALSHIAEQMGITKWSPELINEEYTGRTH